MAKKVTAEVTRGLSIDASPRRVGRYRSYPVAKPAIVKGDRRPWIRELGLTDAFGDLCRHILIKFFAGDPARISTRAELRTKRVEAACEEFWRAKHPYAFRRYFKMKGQQLTGSLLADRIYNQWYERQKNGWKKTGSRSKEHPEIKWNWAAGGTSRKKQIL